MAGAAPASLDAGAAAGGRSEASTRSPASGALSGAAAPSGAMSSGADALEAATAPGGGAAGAELASARPAGLVCRSSCASAAAGAAAGPSGSGCRPVRVSKAPRASKALRNAAALAAALPPPPSPASPPSPAASPPLPAASSAAARACLRQHTAAPSGLVSCYLVWVQVRGQRVARPVWRLRGRARARAHPARPLHHLGQALRPPALQRLPPFRPRHIIVLPV